MGGGCHYGWGAEAHGWSWRCNAWPCKQVSLCLNWLVLQTATGPDPYRNHQHISCIYAKMCMPACFEAIKLYSAITLKQAPSKSFIPHTLSNIGEVAFRDNLFYSVKNCFFTSAVNFHRLRLMLAKMMHGPDVWVSPLHLAGEWCTTGFILHVRYRLKSEYMKLIDLEITVVNEM